MIDPPKIVQRPAVKMASIHIIVPREQIRDVMGPGYQELLNTLKAQGVKPTGAWFTHHFEMHPDAFDFEIAVPVDADVKLSGRVRPGVLPEMRVAQTVYHGSYEGLPDGWMEFETWMNKNGHKIGAGLVEVYRVGPESGDDASKWQTELNRPLAE